MSEAVIRRHYDHYEVIAIDGLWYVMEQATLHLSKAYSGYDITTLRFTIRKAGRDGENAAPID